MFGKKGHMSLFGAEHLPLDPVNEVPHVELTTSKSTVPINKQSP